jgi:LemA protein
MKKIFALVLFSAIFFAGCNYNSLVEKRESVEAQWANVENQYQKRADLVPNLVSVVKGFAAQEKEIYAQIAESREHLGGTIQLDASITEDPEKFQQYQAAQNNLSASLGRLLSVTENYPELKSNENFLTLQSQLEGIENRISTERKRYNDAVSDYNTTIQKFPGCVSAKMFGFSKKEYFKTDASNYVSPKVEF